MLHSNKSYFDNPVQQHWCGYNCCYPTVMTCTDVCPSRCRNNEGCQWQSDHFRRQNILLLLAYHNYNNQIKVAVIVAVITF